MICDFMSQCELEHIQSMNICVQHEKFINLIIEHLRKDTGIKK